jgi:hypothetical protein
MTIFLVFQQDFVPKGRVWNVLGMCQVPSYFHCPSIDVVTWVSIVQWQFTHWIFDVQEGTPGRVRTLGTAQLRWAGMYLHTEYTGRQK